MFVQVSVQILILLLSKKYTETPTTGGFEIIFNRSGAFGKILNIKTALLTFILRFKLYLLTLFRY